MRVSQMFGAAALAFAMAKPAQARDDSFTVDFIDRRDYPSAGTTTFEKVLGGGIAGLLLAASVGAGISLLTHRPASPTETNGTGKLKGHT